MLSPSRPGSNNNIALLGRTELTETWKCESCGYANNQIRLFQCQVCTRSDESRKQEYRSKVIQPVKPISTEKVWKSQKQALDERRRKMELSLMEETNFDNADYKPPPKQEVVSEGTVLASVASLVSHSHPPSVVSMSEQDVDSNLDIDMASQPPPSVAPDDDLPSVVASVPPSVVASDVDVASVAVSVQ